MEQVENTLTQSMDEVASGLGISKGIFRLETLLPAVIILVVCLIIIKILLKVVDRVLDKGKIEKSLHVFLRSTIKYVSLFVTVLLVAASLGVNVTSLVAVFSVLGLAVSLAVQGALSNLAGGIMVLVSKPFKVGDYVDAGGVEGTVKEIGLVHTRLLTVDNKMIFVPNGDISTAKITNYTYEERRRVDMKFTASYDAPVELVYRALRETVMSIPAFLPEEEPFVQVSGYLDSSIEYVVRAWTKTEDYWTAYFALLEGVKKRFDEFGVEMTYSHVNVHMIEASAKEK